MNGPGYIVERVRIRAHGLDPAAPPVHLAHLSDLHVRPDECRFRALVEDLNARKLDAVLISGDSVYKHEDAWETMRKAIEPLRARQGVFACRGNWEIKHEGPSVSATRDVFASAGVTLLVNESRTLQLPAGPVRVAGVDDIVSGWPDFRATLAGEAPPYTILLAHAPLAAELVPPGLRADLVLSGHTHGGQIRLPLLWQRMLPRGSGVYANGLYELPGRMLYVSRGFGMVGWFNVRFRCPAEVTVLEILGA